jgi:hypothetical protein
VHGSSGEGTDVRTCGVANYVAIIIVVVVQEPTTICREVVEVSYDWRLVVAVTVRPGRRRAIRGNDESDRRTCTSEAAVTGPRARAADTPSVCFAGPAGWERRSLPWTTSKGA